MRCYLYLFEHHWKKEVRSERNACVFEAELEVASTEHKAKGWNQRALPVSAQRLL